MTLIPVIESCEGVSVDDSSPVKLATEDVPGFLEHDLPGVTCELPWVSSYTHTKRLTMFTVVERT